MKLAYLQKPSFNFYTKVQETKEHPRHWKTLTDLEIQLSDGYILKIPKGYVWDGASVPKILWFIFPPIDDGLLGDLIHDKLWEDKQAQFHYFNYNTYKARKFADKERMRWRKAHAQDKKVFNFISNLVIRLIGGLYYSKQLNIPT